MNLILIHGNGLVSQINKISAIKKGFDPLSITEFSGKGLSFPQALIHFSTPQLFSDKRLVILEDFDPTSQSFAGQADLEKLPNDNDLTIIFKFNKQLPVTNSFLKQAVKLKAQVFSFTEQDEANIFPYLDLLADKNMRALAEVDWRLKEHGSQYLFTMMIYMLRRLVQRPKNLPPFVLKKMDKQRQFFPEEKTKMFYKEILETDFKIKSGLMEEKMALTLLVNKFLTI